jgi:hypothetical protein
VQRPSDRWDRLGVRVSGRAKQGDNVLLAGSSQKFCDFHELGDATEYARTVLRKLRKHTKRPLVYRPKPSWGGAVPVEGFGYSPASEKFVTELSASHALVTFGSNACFEALLAGVPTLILGDGVTRGLSITDYEDIESAEWPGSDAVYLLGCNLAYCQFTVSEMANGMCWSVVREHLGKKIRAAGTK